MERKVSRGLKYNGNKKEASNCQRTSGMEEDLIGKQGLEWTIAGVEKTDVVTRMNWFVSCKFYEGIITDCNVEIKEVTLGEYWGELVKGWGMWQVGIRRTKLHTGLGGGT